MAGKFPNKSQNDVDLTLRLGVSDDEDKQQIEEQKVMHDFLGVEGGHAPYHDQVNFPYPMPPGQVNRHAGFVAGGGPALHAAAAYPPLAAYAAANASNVAFYQGFVPQNRSPARRRPNAEDDKFCVECGTANTPLWRKGPDGPQTLCNACGLRHSRTARRN